MSDDTQFHVACTDQYAVDSERTIVVYPLSGQVLNISPQHMKNFRSSTGKTKIHKSSALCKKSAQPGPPLLFSHSLNENKAKLAVEFYFEQRELGNNISQRRVAEIFNVPRSTLNDRIQARRKLSSPVE